MQLSRTEYAGHPVALYEKTHDSSGGGILDFMSDGVTEIEYLTEA